MYGSKSVFNNHRNGKLYSPNPSRKHTFLTTEEVAAGKKSQWNELELTGNIKNISINLFDWTHLTSLYLNDNHLQHLPASICMLHNLMHLDLSGNKLRTLPGEIGDMTHLRELLLNNNQIRVLPFEVGKLFLLQNIGLDGNPLSPDIRRVYNGNGTQRLVQYLLDHLTSKCSEKVDDWPLRKLLLELGGHPSHLLDRLKQ